MSMSNQEFNQQHSALLSEKYQNTINNIRQLQEIEKYMYQNLEQAQANESQDTQMQQQIVERINQLSETRVGLFNQLKEVYSMNQDELNDDRNELAQQLGVVGVVENELNRTKRNVDALQSDKTNKMRLVEIGNYEVERYNAHIGVMKIIAYSSLFVLAISYLNKKGFIPVFIPSFVVTFTILAIVIVALIMVVMKVADLMRRSNMNYRQYDFAYDPAQAAAQTTDGVLHHDKIFFEKLGGEIKDGYKQAKQQFSKTVSGLSKNGTSVSNEISGLANGGSMNNSTSIQNTGNGDNVAPNEPSNMENFQTFN